ncbi:MAG: lysylphosphatidylglycerol synthase transmembrane domain-containing protein [Ignavibacteriaceae bacterium]|jgi:uncharacterized membrane protein YbhN (UPF0104 family)
MMLSLSKKEKLFLLGKILVAGAIMVYLFQRFQSFDYGKIFTHQNLHIMGWVCFLTFINIYIQLHKWKNVFFDLLGELPFKKIFSSFFVGVATGSFTPGRFGEYFGRSYMIKEYPGSEVISASVVDKLSNMVVLIFSGSFSTIWFLSVTSAVSLRVIYLLTFLVVCFLLVLIYFIIQKRGVANFYKRIEKVRLLKKLFFHLQLIKKVSKRTIFHQFGYSILLYCIIALQYGILTAGFANKPIEIAFLFCGILTLFVKSFIPSISFGDLGIRESASIFFISAIGLPAEVGFLSAFSIFLFNILLPSAIGLIFLVTVKR